MLVLQIAQHSTEEKIIAASFKRSGGHTFRDRSTLKTVTSPLVIESVLKFDSLCDMWPNITVEVEGIGQQKLPPWGYCWYSADSWPNVYKENWDSSG